MSERTNSRGEPLRDRTREEYERLLRPAAPKGKSGKSDKGGPLAPLLDEVIGDITPDVVRAWRSKLMKTGAKTQTARAYDLLKSIFRTAVNDKIADENPCQIRGGSTTSTNKSVEPPTKAELAVILATIRTEYRALVIAAASGGLRYGEATALRAKDVTVVLDGATGAVDAVRLNVREAVVKTHSGRIVGSTKSDAGVRNVAIFGEDAKVIASHIQGKVGDELLFTSADGTSHLPQTTFFRHWRKARAAVGRDDMPFHALRHYAGTSYAQTGATVAETMARLGHSSTKAAMRYQHSGSRDDELARRMAR